MRPGGTWTVKDQTGPRLALRPSIAKVLQSRALELHTFTLTHIYKHTHSHPPLYTHAHVCTFMPANPNLHLRSHARTSAHTHMCTCVSHTGATYLPMNACICTATPIQAVMHADTHHIHTCGAHQHMHACIYTCVHAPIQNAHIHVCIVNPRAWSVFTSMLLPHFQNFTEVPWHHCAQFSDKEQQHRWTLTPMSTSQSRSSDVTTSVLLAPPSFPFSISRAHALLWQVTLTTPFTAIHRHLSALGSCVKHILQKMGNWWVDVDRRGHGKHFC